MSRLAISTKNCIVEKHGKILVVTLARPEAKNALTPAMLIGMYQAWRLLDRDDELLCAVLTGQGDTFCAGMDLKAGPNGGEGGEGGEDVDEIRRLMQDVPDLHWQALLRHNPPMKPVILAVEGYALAGGTEILQGTDLRVAAEDATLGITEVQRGLFPLGGSTIRLRRQIPYCLAAEMLLLGRHITAQEALRFGLINKVVPHGQALAEAMNMAAQICENGPLSVRAITRSLRENGHWLSEQEALANEEVLGWSVLGSNDAKEGMRAFKEKRKPVFTGS
ncbi:MAG: crotonase/enoyl-CoA hydratase family protein [Sterolibacterium sp.]|jgi:enoyl-CoA hydratase|nr:crotonase/enoyl-CoA hydratase family protein [Sterolibacterium sp.]